MKLFAISLLFLSFLPGCRGMLYRQTGKVMSGYAEEHMVPQLMGDADVDMVCETGVSMGAFLLSFKRVVAVPEQVGAVTMLSAAMCAEFKAWEEELRGLRAIREGRSAEASDARISEKRAHAVAASRFLRAYQLTSSAYGPIGEGCPSLGEQDGVFYLLGLSSGLLAVIHDRAAAGVVGVPMDIPARVTRASVCLDNERFWGVPLALQAAIWISVPGKTPANTDPWAVLESAAVRGEAAGVRLARAFQVQAASTVGNEAMIEKAIAAHAASLEATPAHQEWRLLDAYATFLIRHESDRIWTRSEGHRTEQGSLGTFPRAAELPGDGSSDSDDGLLDGLDD